MSQALASRVDKRAVWMLTFILLRHHESRWRERHTNKPQIDFLQWLSIVDLLRCTCLTIL